MAGMVPFDEASRGSILRRLAGADAPVRVRLAIEGPAADLAPEVELWLAGGRILGVRAGGLDAARALVLVGLVPSGVLEVHAEPTLSGSFDDRPLLADVLGRAEAAARAIAGLVKPLGGLGVVFLFDFVALGGRRLTEDSRAVIDRIDGARSVAEVLAQSPLEPLATAQVLDRLHGLGLLQPVDVRVGPRPSLPVAVSEPPPPPAPKDPEGFTGDLIYDDPDADSPEVVAPPGLEDATESSGAREAEPDEVDEPEVDPDVAAPPALARPAAWVGVGMILVLILVAAASLQLRRPPPPPPAPAVARPEPAPPPPPPPVEVVVPVDAGRPPAAPRYTLARPPPIAGPEADLRLREAEALINAGRLDEADQRLKTLRDLLPDDPTVFVLSGHLEAERERYPKARGYLAKALELDPKHYRAHVLLGIAHQFEGQVDDAVRAYRRALAIDPDHPLSREVASVVRGLER